MTPSEFKSWFEGFTEALTGVPTKAQWARIKERVAEIDGKPITERVFIDRYWGPYYNWPPYYPYGIGSSKTPQVWTNWRTVPSGNNTGGSYCSNTAMYAAGKADALAMTQARQW